MRHTALTGIYFFLPLFRVIILDIEIKIVLCINVHAFPYSTREHSQVIKGMERSAGKHPQGDYSFDCLKVKLNHAFPLGFKLIIVFKYIFFQKNPQFIIFPIRKILPFYRRLVQRVDYCNSFTR